MKNEWDSSKSVLFPVAGVKSSNLNLLLSILTFAGVSSDVKVNKTKKCLDHGRNASYLCFDVGSFYIRLLSPQPPCDNLLHCSGSSYFIFLPASHRKSWFEYFGWYFVRPFFIFLPVCLQLQARQSQYHQGLPVQWKKKPTVCRVNVSSASCLTAMKYRTNIKGWSLKFTSFFAPITTSLILLYFMFKRFRCLCATSSTQPERLVRYFQNKTQKKVVFLIFGLFLFCFFSRNIQAACSPCELSCSPASRDGKTSHRSVWPARPKASMSHRRRYCCRQHRSNHAARKVSPSHDLWKNTSQTKPDQRCVFPEPFLSKFKFEITSFSFFIRDFCCCEDMFITVTSFLTMPDNWVSNQCSPAVKRQAGQSGLWVNQLFHTGILMMPTFCALCQCCLTFILTDYSAVVERLASNPF